MGCTGLRLERKAILSRCHHFNHQGQQSFVKEESYPFMRNMCPCVDHESRERFLVFGSDNMEVLTNLGTVPGFRPSRSHRITEGQLWTARVWNGRSEHDLVS